MALHVDTLAVARGYTDLVALGLSDVTVSGTTVTFTIASSGEQASVTLPTPKDGKDGVSITDVNVTADNELICTMSDGSQISGGVINLDDVSYDDTEIKNEIDKKADKTELDGLATETYVDDAIAKASLKGGDLDLSTYATTEYVDNAVKNVDVDLIGYATEEYVITTLSDYAKTDEIPDTSNFVEKEEGKGLFSGKYEDLTGTPTIPSIDGLVTEDLLNSTLINYAKSTDIPTELPANGGNADTVNNHTVDIDVPADAKFTDTIYDDTTLSNRVGIIEDDYLTSNDKTELTDAIATAKQEAIETVLGETVDVDFDTLQEVAEWIQSDTTNSAELINRVTTVETNLGGHTVESDVPTDAKFTDTVYDDTDVKNRITSVENGIVNLEDTKADTNHTHTYAGSSTVGGSATSAVKLDTNTAGGVSQPVYFSEGKPVAVDYTLGDACEKGVDTEVTSGSNNLITSDGVNTALLGIYLDDASDIVSSYTVTNTTSSVDVTASYDMGFTFKHIKLGKVHFVTISGGKKIYNTTTAEYRTNLTIEVIGSFFAGYELYVSQGGGLTTFNDVVVSLGTDKTTITQVYVQPNSTGSYSPDSIYQFRKVLMLIEN